MNVLKTGLPRRLYLANAPGAVDLSAPLAQARLDMGGDRLIAGSARVKEDV